MSQSKIEGLRTALAAAPNTHALRQMLAELLVEEGDAKGAAAEYAALVEADALRGKDIVAAGRAGAAAEQWALVDRALEAGARTGVVEGLGELRRLRDAALGQQGVLRMVAGGARDRKAPEPAEEAPTITFSDVGGMAEVKKAIARTIILPFQRPDLYERYGRKSGGGVLLYGPPGCGKTMLARAVAGECRLPFVNIRIENILDPYLGVSESNLHDAFEQGRRKRPCVLFLDELDGLAFARGKQRGGAGRTLVDQLLQELDAIGADNDKMLILAATNAPWDVDDAVKRPGRFDRVLFVPPPDVDARAQVLDLHVRGRPAGKLDTTELARRTGLFSGADLQSLVERAVDLVIDEALETGKEPPLAQKHFERALEGQRPSTVEWLARARNYVEFANAAEGYADVERFLRSKEAEALRKLFKEL